jgi:hypothetical protein
MGRVAIVIPPLVGDEATVKYRETKNKEGTIEKHRCFKMEQGWATQPVANKIVHFRTSRRVRRLRRCCVVLLQQCRQCRTHALQP